MSGPACALSEVRHNGFAVAGGVTLKQQNARLCAIVRGFDGKEVDRVERIGQRTEQSTYLSGGEGAWYEYERGNYVQATGDNIGSLWLSVALDSMISQRPLPIGRHLSGGGLTRVLFAEDERDFVAAYSNCLGGIARSKPGGYIAGRRHTHYTFGAATSPGGTDNRTFAMAVQAESAQEARALSGSYNPFTHQIARHSPGYQSPLALTQPPETQEPAFKRALVPSILQTAHAKHHARRCQIRRALTRTVTKMGCCTLGTKNSRYKKIQAPVSAWIF
ncbi:hypothetical protein SAMN05216580_2843 [Geopseudomonas guangdongensis]|uniref:Uncharacterized protein n=2 Tax=Geopseudomonas guangdongensis TaxID=1245526 RepID=A0A1H2IA80_9GAMM|nr:hypothetical protein SAMN05216580_2843 [Pseudomonas guangdongensis]